MKALVQRVSRASVGLPGGASRGITPGLLVLLGVSKKDSVEDAQWLAAKVSELRVFSNSDGKFDLSLLDVKGQALVISQFTLYGDCAKGRRPDFTAAAEPAKARVLYEEFVRELSRKGVKTETGEFGEHMVVELVNDGPVTVMVEREGGA